MKVLLVDPHPERARLLHDALVASGNEVVAMLADSHSLLVTMVEAQPDLVIIDMDAPDRDTLESLRSVDQDNPSPVVMFAEKSDPDTTAQAIRAGVSAYVVDGIDPKRLNSIMHVAIARFEEHQALKREHRAVKKELEDTKVKLAERRDIEKAKGLLMNHKKLPEDRAFQLMRKLAMDRNVSLGKIAREIISAAELLS